MLLLSAGVVERFGCAFFEAVMGTFNVQSLVTVSLGPCNVVMSLFLICASSLLKIAVQP